MSLDARSARAFVLVAWSGFLLWLWASGEVVRYLGPRTEWVVPVGSVLLVLVAWAYCRENGRREAWSRLRLGEGAGLGTLLLPIVAGAVLSTTQLGALAASTKLSERGIDPSALASLASKDASHPDFVQIDVAGHNSKFAKQSGLTAGRGVRLVGFVSGTPKHGELHLARFYIACCVADAVPIDVPVRPGPRARGPYRRDEWLDVTATLRQRGREYVLDASKINPVSAPQHPYLYFSPS